MKQIFTALLLLAAMGLAANNLQITRVALVDNDPVAKTVMIEFDLSWDNSWRDDINWDAAWVIAKYFTGELPYPHCKLALEGAAPGGGTGHTLIVPDDSLTLNDTPYGVGAFIYRDAPGSGTFAATGVRLKWNYGLNGFETLPEDIEVSLYATEMVYIPEGPFAFGDGDGTNASQYSWRVKGTSDYVYIGDYLAPLMVNPNSNGDEQARIHGIRVHGKEGLDWDGDGVIDNSNYPTGFKSFYIMKHKVTQGQYADFLNSLTPAQISNANLFPNTIQSRYTIVLQDGIYSCSRPDRSANYMTYSYTYSPALSMADWMGLRPISELEYEKAARGPIVPMKGEFSWGTTTINLITELFGEENGTETPLPVNSNFNGWGHLIGGDGGYGPVRAGIFFGEQTNRINSGASYYGVAELSGSPFETMVTLLSNKHPQQFTIYYYRGFQGYNGDGELYSSGFANSFRNLTLTGGTVNFQSAYNVHRAGSVSNNSGFSADDSGARFVRNAPELP